MLPVHIHLGRLNEAVKDLGLVPKVLVTGLSWSLDILVGSIPCDLKLKV